MLSGLLKAFLWAVVGKNRQREPFFVMFLTVTCSYFLLVHVLSELHASFVANLAFYLLLNLESQPLVENSVGKWQEQIMLSYAVFAALVTSMPKVKMHQRVIGMILGVGGILLFNVVILSLTHSLGFLTVGGTYTLLGKITLTLGGFFSTVYVSFLWIYLSIFVLKKPITI